MGNRERINGVTFWQAKFGLLNMKVVMLCNIQFLPQECPTQRKYPKASGADSSYAGNNDTNWKSVVFFDIIILTYITSP